MRLSNSEISVFEEQLEGVVTVGYYKDKTHYFSHSVKNDMAVWYYSTSFDTWFKQEEIQFT